MKGYAIAEQPTKLEEKKKKKRQCCYFEEKNTHKIIGAQPSTVYTISGPLTQGTFILYFLFVSCEWTLKRRYTEFKDERTVVKWILCVIGHIAGINMIIIIIIFSNFFFFFFAQGNVGSDSNVSPSVNPSLNSVVTVNSERKPREEKIKTCENIYMRKLETEIPQRRRAIMVNNNNNE